MGLGVPQAARAALSQGGGARCGTGKQGPRTHEPGPPRPTGDAQSLICLAAAVRGIGFAIKAAQYDDPLNTDLAVGCEALSAETGQGWRCAAGPSAAADQAAAAWWAAAATQVLLQAACQGVPH